MTEPKVEVQAPALPNVFRGNVGNVIFSVGVLMFAAFIGSAYLLAAHRATYPVASVVLSAIWVVGVPLYFFFEHVYLFRKYGEPSQYEQFKHLQELAGKVWAGAIVVLAAFFTGGPFSR